MVDDWSAIFKELPTRWLGRTYRFLPEIDSTNRYIQERLAELPHGAVVCTDFQTAGRGRLGRTWEAPPATGLLCSLLVRPDWPAEEAGWLTMIAGLAALEAIEAVTGLAVQLKWPNDVVRQRTGEDQVVKLGGILLEGGFAQDRLRHGVIGIGLNVNLQAEDLPPGRTTPSSLLLETGRPVSRPALLAALLVQFETWYDRCAQGESPLQSWRGRLITLGREVTVREMGQNAAQTEWTGVAEEVDESGRLLVRQASGQLRTVAAGDVTLL